MNLTLHQSIVEHWHCRYEELQLSSNDFYTALEKELKAKAFPNVVYHRELLTEHGFLSRKREYLVVSCGEYKFVICAAPFGRNFFFSWYLEHYLSFLCFMPIIGKWVLKSETNKTYFEFDSGIMFKESIKQVVNTVLEEVAKTKGVRDNQQAVISLN